MARSPDFLIIGAGIAGLSVAYELSLDHSVVVLEAESSPAYHTTGRSAALFAAIAADGPAQTLSRLSREFFARPPKGFARGDLAQPLPVIYTVTAQDQEDLQPALSVLQSSSTRIEQLSGPEVHNRVPVMSEEITAGLLDTDGFRIDVGGLCEGYRRGLLARGGEIHTRERVAVAEPLAQGFKVTTDSGKDYRAARVINAAGAWGDEVADLFGATPVGLSSLRRTMIVFNPPQSVDVSTWPAVGGLNGGYYFLPDAGRLMGSAADAVSSPPCDSVPEEWDIALAAHRIESATTLQVREIVQSWSGLRTFAPDHQPVAGFDPVVRDFFWFVGQGGFGIQSGPALAKAAACLAREQALPAEQVAAGVSAEALAPDHSGASSRPRKIGVA